MTCVQCVLICIKNCVSIRENLGALDNITFCNYNKAVCPGGTAHSVFDTNDNANST